MTTKSAETNPEQEMPFADSIWEASDIGEWNMTVEGKGEEAMKATVSLWHVKEAHETWTTDGDDEDLLMSSDGIDKKELVTGRIEPGWYYASCQPGCLLESTIIGPFEKMSEALSDAVYGDTSWQDEFKEYDDEYRLR